MAEVTVRTPLSADDALRLHDWIKGQVNMPVILNVQTSNAPSEYYGNGINGKIKTALSSCIPTPNC